jgi:23S rRNA G2069 N7-methylase RlmK/C1962 C5-methylase RlmI
MTNKPILDACCGGRMFWFDKQNPLAVFCDNREFTDTLCDGRVFEVKPDILADFTSLPFEDGAFKLVVFDPPHLLKSSAKSWLTKKYGNLFVDWEDDLSQGFSECMRVLDDYGILIFKWSENDITVKRILEVIKATPLFGHKSGQTSKTHWMCFMKMPNAEVSEG